MSPTKLRLACTLIAMLASVRTAMAQNLLANPDFDAGLGLSSWQVGEGSVAAGADSGGCSLSEAMDGTSGLSGGGSQFFQVLSECIPVAAAANPVWNVGGMYKTTADVFARLTLSQYSDIACGTQTGFSETIFAESSASWNRVSGEVHVAANTLAVVLYVDANPAVVGAPQFTVQWDRFYLGLAPEVFRDGFEVESGSACHWSAISGAL